MGRVPDSSNTRAALVIGAQGALGEAVGAQLQATGWTVYPAGRRTDRRAGYRRIDLDRIDSVRGALHDVDLVVSAVPHSQLSAERAVLEHGGVLVNCSHAPGVTAAALTAETKEARGTVLLNAGLAPGVTNLLAAELLKQHPDADCLEVAFTVFTAGTAGKAGGEFAHKGLTSRRHHRVVALPLPEPFGALRFIQVAEGEDGGYGGLADGRVVEAYLGFADRPLNLALRALNATRLISLLPRAAFTRNRGEGDEVSGEPMAVWVGVRSGAQRLAVSLLECEGSYRATAAAARLFAEALLDGEHPPGCYNPEDLFGLDDLLPACEAAGLRITRDRSPLDA